MATITATDAGASTAATATQITLDGAGDTFAYTPNKRALLVLRNPTAGSLSPVIDGDGASTVGVAGVGAVDISGGYAVGSIPVGAARVVRLDAISAYLAGTIAITGGTGLVATLLEF
ncbi:MULTISPECIES: hypothetical protein [unclassified Sulfitobacter]|jgi:hypothetical protein|uniref:hypothetical protein n=1 Tax=unclassified Sulfitobacter TaxID=196795 RepID=UPI0007C21614|nr:MULTISPECIES: hypothetical protein [unclassified Sulfitobacter]KZY05267.1 hypothetical protein A3721_15160 [Sulfitobacter sp. HI0023]KZY26837.1 hypothetical protein A3728_14805 [Sulfitobacter sp. HI0040]KZZ62436.1 hypothetical protein A3764_06260 [Sulfitobacter sp. HI0129]